MIRVVKLLLTVVIVAGMIWFGANLYASHRLRAALDETLQHLPPDYTATYASAQYNFFGGHGTVGDIAIKRAGSAGFTVKIETLDVAHPDWSFSSGWKRAVGNPDSFAPDAALPVADAIAITNLRLAGTGMESTFASAEIDGLRLYPWALLRPGLISFADALAILGHQPQLPEDEVRLLKLDAAYGVGFGYDHYTATKYHGHVTIPATDGTDTVPATPERTVTYAVEHFEGGHVDRGILENADVTGITFDGGLTGGATVDRVHIDGLDFRQPALALLNGAALEPSLANGIKLGSLGYDGVKVSVLGHPSVTLGGFSLGNVTADHGVLSSLDVKLNALKLSEDSFEDVRAAAAFEALGLEAMTVSLDSQFRWDGAAKKIALTDKLKVDELGSVDLDAALADADPAAVKLETATLTHAKLDYTDASLADRLYAFGAKELATDKPGMKQIAVKAVVGAAAQAGDSTAIKQAVDQLVAFLENPKSLTILLDPQKPVTLAALELMKDAPGPAVETLGLKVQANGSH